MISNRIHRLIFVFALCLFLTSGFARGIDWNKNSFSPLRGDALAASCNEALAEGSSDVVIHSFRKDSLKRMINRDARRASLMSALLPGLGQIYNRKYWKVPIIYAGLGGLGYFALGHNSEYQKYHNELLFRYANNGQVNSLSEYSTDNLITLKNQSKKYRDMCFIGMGIFYVLNIIDANVDAHLKRFDVSDDLTLSVAPKAFYCMQSKSGLGGGISLALHFK